MNGLKINSRKYKVVYMWYRRCRLWSEKDRRHVLLKKDENMDEGDDATFLQKIWRDIYGRNGKNCADERPLVQ